MVVFLPQLLYPQRKSLQYPLYRRLGGPPRAGLNAMGKREISSSNGNLAPVPWPSSLYPVPVLMKRSWLSFRDWSRLNYLSSNILISNSTYAFYCVHQLVDSTSRYKAYVWRRYQFCQTTFIWLFRPCVSDSVNSYYNEGVLNVCFCEDIFYMFFINNERYFKVRHFQVVITYDLDIH